MRRVQFALNELWRFTDDMFVMNEVDEELISMGISINLNDIQAKWKFTISEIFAEANLQMPESTNIIKGGSKGIHTEHLGHLLCEMQYLQRAHPDATW
jgi:ring-1,2-phenylacetyl-CoA epoxidase subunit PaaC